MPTLNDAPTTVDHSKTCLPRGLGYLAALVSAIIALSAVAGAVASMISSPPTWFLLGFEAATLVAAVFGVLIGLGRFASAPGLALACVAGSVAASAFLGYLSAARELMNVGLEPFLIARVLAAFVLAGIGALAVLIRRPGVSLPRLAAGGACGLAMGGLLIGAWKASGALGSLGVPAQAIIGFVMFGLALGLLAASVHLIIAAFESCDVDHLDGAPESGRAA